MIAPAFSCRTTNTRCIKLLPIARMFIQKSPTTGSLLPDAALMLKSGCTCTCCPFCRSKSCALLSHNVSSITVTAAPLSASHSTCCPFVTDMTNGLLSPPVRTRSLITVSLHTESSPMVYSLGLGLPLEVSAASASENPGRGFRRCGGLSGPGMPGPPTPPGCSAAAGRGWP